MVQSTRDGYASSVVNSVGNDVAHDAVTRALRSQTLPYSEVEIGQQVRAVCAREATPAEASEYYELFVAALPAYAEYRQRTARRIPVVILESR
jgi:hypothetical protein